MKLLVLLSMLVLLPGCAAMLPKSQDKPVQPWKTFEEAKASYNRIEPFVTTMNELRALGFDPYATPNIRMLNHAQVVEIVLPAALPPGVEMPPGIRECMIANDGCLGFFTEGGRQKRDRVGNFLLDFMNFKRHTVTTGWNFSALIVTVGDKVVYKQWSGSPNTKDETVNTNPLGPLQGIGASPSLYY